MKILITGSFSTGKTTLANQLAEIKKIDLLPEVARQMIQEGFKLDENISIDTEREMFHRQQLLEIGDDFIADRGIIDILAYTSVLFQDNYQDFFGEENDLAEILIKEIKEGLEEAEYDVVFYLPVEFPIEDDGVRSMDSRFQKQVDGKIKNILEKYEHKFKNYTIRGSKEKRLKDVLELLGT